MGGAPVDGDVTQNQFIPRKEAWERVSVALLSRLSEHIRPTTRTEKKLLDEYGYGPTYQPGTRYLAGAGYNPFAEIEQGEDHAAVQDAQRRYRDWRWHSQQVDDWLGARGFDGRKFEREGFETEFAKCFISAITAGSTRGPLQEAPLSAGRACNSASDSSEALLAALPDNRELTAELIRLPKDEPRSEVSAAAWKAMNFFWPGGGVPSNLRTAAVHAKVNAWIKKQPRNTVSVEKVSRETVERLLGRRK